MYNCLNSFVFDHFFPDDFENEKEKRPKNQPFWFSGKQRR